MLSLQCAKHFYIDYMYISIATTTNSVSNKTMPLSYHRITIAFFELPHLLHVGNPENTPYVFWKLGQAMTHG